jgi:hypothetical protein
VLGPPVALANVTDTPVRHFGVRIRCLGRGSLALRTWTQERRMIYMLLSLLNFLFWPALIVGLILLFRRKGAGQRRELEQYLAELSDALRQLKLRTDELADRVDRMEQRGVAPSAPVEAESVPTTADLPREEARTLREIPGVEPSATLTTPVTPVAAPAIEESVPELARRRHELEQRFVENWTGILGAVVVVAGVTFVGIYTALKLAPFYRFLLTLAAAGVFAGGAYVLGRKEAWRTFAGWLRSTGAAIALFACAAAGGLPGLGLQWITAPLPALGVLLAGIAANLFLAYAGGTEVMATLHVLLSLLPLAIVPASTTSLAIASAVALFGVTLAAHGRWDRHLAIVLGAFLAFQTLWYGRMGLALDADVAGYLAAGCAALVFGSAALVHYRKDYARPASPPLLQVGVHLTNWALLALALFVYVPAALSRGAALLVFGVLAYRLAQRARALRVAWLQRADTLVAQAFVLLALLSGYDLGASGSLLLLIVLAETLAFRWLVSRGEDPVLDRIIDAMPTAAAALLAVSGPMDLGLPAERHVGLAAVLLGGATLAVLGQWVLRTPHEDALAVDSARDIDEWLGTPGAALGALSGVLVVAALAAVADRPWLEVAALVTVSSLLVARLRLRRAGLRAAATFALVSAHLMSWAMLLSGRDWTVAALTPRIVPLAGLAAVAIGLARSGRSRVVPITLLGITAGLAAFLYFDPVSPLIPGVAWLMLSLVALEVANRRAGHESLTVLMLGYGYIAAFAAAYALVIVQSPAYVGAVSARLLIELFAVAVLAYWWSFRPHAALAEERPWMLVHPLFVEVILIGVAVTVVVELASQWWAVAWAVVGLLLLSPPGERLLDARARLYSLLFYWVSVVDMAVVMSTLEVPSPRWFDRPAFTSLVAIALQVAYVAWAHRQLVLQGLETPAPLRVLGRLGARAAARRNLFVYYPLFAGIALFLYWRFDRSLLTLLWAAEAFVIFGLATWLRENRFRYVALGGLAACLARLVLIDMAQANLALRGLVFIGVGLLMLGMNAIYNRYRARFEA